MAANRKSVLDAIKGDLNDAKRLLDLDSQSKQNLDQMTPSISDVEKQLQALLAGQTDTNASNGASPVACK